MIQHRPFVLICPGDTIREEILARGWSQKDFAKIIDMSPKSINLLINNKQPVTFETASRLSKVFGQSIQFWLNQEAIYRKHLESTTDKIIEPKRPSIRKVKNDEQTKNLKSIKEKIL